MEKMLKSAVTVFAVLLFSTVCTVEAMNLYVTSSKKCYTAQDAKNITPPAANLVSVAFDAFKITKAKLASGDPVYLNVNKCYDGQMGINVPWSEAATASLVSTMEFFSSPCAGSLPTTVEITLAHGYSCELTAYDKDNNLVDTATATSGSTPQVLTLTSSDGIKYIKIDGAEICILSVCLDCDNQTGPDPSDDCPPEVIEAAMKKGYEEGYKAGLEAASASTGSGECATVSDSLDIIIPCLKYGESTFPLKLKFTGDIFQNNLTWSLE